MKIPLRELLRSETDRVEWKSSLKQSEEIIRAVCALANDLRNSGDLGYLVLGVDRSGKPVGLSFEGSSVDDEQQRLSNRLRSVKLLPTPSFDIDVVEHEGAVLFVVGVQPYDVPPLVQVGGVTYVRSASTTVKATEADEIRLRERRPEGREPFDCRIARNATLEDLDLGRLMTRHATSREMDGEPATFPEFPAWLTQLDLGRPIGGVFRPSFTALLVYGRSPQTHLPGATVELVRFAGLDVDSPILARKTITGALPDQLEAAWAQMQDRIAEMPRGSVGIREVFTPEYPVEALKELVRNMLQHRQYDATHAPARIEWYRDRIELSNPGAPFGRASAGEFGSESDYRNPNLTRHLVDLGYVQKLGRGIRLVRRQLAQNGNPPLAVEIDGFTRVIVRGLT